MAKAKRRSKTAKPSNPAEQKDHRAVIEAIYDRYFTPNEDIPVNRQFYGANLRQPDVDYYVDVITVYGNAGPKLTF